jgi:hypothetical protein
MLRSQEFSRVRRLLSVMMTQRSRAYLSLCRSFRRKLLTANVDVKMLQERRRVDAVNPRWELDDHPELPLHKPDSLIIIGFICAEVS